MKITGYQIREALRRWRDRRDVYSRSFTDSLWQFADSKDGDPLELALSYQEADRAIADLESAQQEFNQKITVKLSDGEFKLSVAVKRIGGAGRLAKMWRTAATSTGKDRYAYSDNRRSKEDEFATRQVTQSVAMKRADEAAVYISQLRAAVAVANGTEIEIENLVTSLLF